MGLGGFFGNGFGVVVIEFIVGLSGLGIVFGGIEGLFVFVDLFDIGVVGVDGIDLEGIF